MKRLERKSCSLGAYLIEWGICSRCHGSLNGEFGGSCMFSHMRKPEPFRCIRWGDDLQTASCRRYTEMAFSPFIGAEEKHSAVLKEYCLTD